MRNRIAARPDEGEAYYALAGVLERVGDGQSEQMVEIKQTLLKSAELGCASAMRMLAVEYMDAGGDLPRDEEKAMLWCERAVAAGDGQAMLDLAASYYFGEGVEKNWLKTAELTRSAAKLRAPVLCARWVNSTARVKLWCRIIPKLSSISANLSQENLIVPRRM